MWVSFSAVLWVTTIVFLNEVMESVDGPISSGSISLSDYTITSYSRIWISVLNYRITIYTGLHMSSWVRRRQAGWFLRLGGLYFLSSTFWSEIRGGTFSLPFCFTFTWRAQGYLQGGHSEEPCSGEPVCALATRLRCSPNFGLPKRLYHRDSVAIVLTLDISVVAQKWL